MQVFARDWRPRGVVLVIAEAVYTVTDPPLQALRKVIPPLTLGRSARPGFLVLMLGVTILMGVISGLSAASSRVDALTQTLGCLRLHC